MSERDQTTFADVAKWGAILLGMVMAVPIVAILASEAPAILLTVIVVGFLAWAGIRSGLLAKDEDDEDATAADPVATLQERYAAGELTETEFERRLERILETDELVKEAAEGLEARAGRARERRDRGEPEPVRERE